VICSAVTREEIQQKTDEMAREYHETHDPEIPEEIYRLARLLYPRYTDCVNKVICSSSFGSISSPSLLPGKDLNLFFPRVYSESQCAEAMAQRLRFKMCTPNRSSLT
jgi:hypothetical protein